MNSLSLNEIAYNLLNNLRGGRSSNNDYLSIEQIKFLINYYRATFIRRDMWRNNLRSTMFEQDLGLLDVTATNPEDSSDYKTITVPTPIRLKNKEAITFVGKIDKSGQPIPVVDKQRSYWNQFNKYTGSDEEAFYRDGSIYISSDNSIDVINVRGIFEDPEAVYDFINSEGIDVYNGNEPYPISADMLKGITKGLLGGELKINVSTVNDDQTDTLQDKQ